MTSHLFAAEHIEQTLKKNGRLIISAVGYSMLPLIPPNSSIEIERCPAADLKLGDILLVKRGASFILHRLFEIRRKNGLFFVTKGDNTHRYDAPVEESMVLGKVVTVGSSKFKKKFWQFANQGIIFFTLKIHSGHKRLAQKKWYKALSGVRAFFIKRKSLVFPLVKKMASIPLALALGQQKLRGAYHLARVFILLPKTHIVKFFPTDSGDAAGRLWERVFPNLRFEHHESLKQHLFFHFLADRPICFLAMNKNRCIGLISACERFRSSRDQPICSLETLAVDPDCRRKGVGSALLDRLKRECQNRNIARITTCWSKVFFPGLHPELHKQAIDFLIQNGFENPTFLDEMILTPETQKNPRFLNRVGKGNAFEEISFGLLTASQKEIFLGFLKQENYELFRHYANIDWSLCFDNPQNQGIVYAEREGKIIGCVRYDALSEKTGPAALHRKWELDCLFDTKASKSYILSLMGLAQKHQSPEAKNLLFDFCFNHLCANGKIAIWDTENSSFFSQFGARKINTYLTLHAQFSTATSN